MPFSFRAEAGWRGMRTCTHLAAHHSVATRNTGMSWPPSRKRRAADITTTGMRRTSKSRRRAVKTLTNRRFPCRPSVSRTALATSAPLAATNGNRCRWPAPSILSRCSGSSLPGRPLRIRRRSCASFGGLIRAVHRQLLSNCPSSCAAACWFEPALAREGFYAPPAHPAHFAPHAT